MKAINRAGNLKRICTHTRRTTRRQEAIARQLAWEALTKQVKLAIIAARPGNSKKERARLEKV